MYHAHVYTGVQWANRPLYTTPVHMLLVEYTVTYRALQGP